MHKSKPKYTKITLCKFCECYFPYVGDPRLACSDECLSLLRSRNARNNPGLGTKRSKQETELFNLCAKIYPAALSNYVISDGWDADIVLPEHKIAILWNGPWHYKEMNIGNHSLAQVQNRDRIKTQLFTELEWNVLVFEDRHYTPQTALEVIITRIDKSRCSKL
jgi:hypothetical protein